MEKSKVILIGLPMYLLWWDLLDLFLAPPSVVESQSDPTLQLEFPIQKAEDLINAFTLSFSACSSYREKAMAAKKMVETEFGDMNVIMKNHPAPLPKRVLNKVVTFVEIGTIVIVMGGEHIFPRLGMEAPCWYLSLRSNRFGSIASIWLLANFFDSFLQTSGAFEVHCNGELVFSKLKERRMPGESELKDIIKRHISATVDILG